MHIQPSFGDYADQPVPRFRTGGYHWSKVSSAAMPLQITTIAHLDYGEDTT